MSNKLLTGALSLCFMLMVGAAAYPVTPKNLPSKLQAEPTVNVNAPFYGMGLDGATPRFTPPPLDRQLHPLGQTAELLLPRTGSPPAFACANQANESFSALATLDIWHFGDFEPDPYLYFGMRFIVPENTVCSLVVSWVHILDIVGDMDLEIGVWTSSGGVPAAQVGSKVFNTQTLNPIASGGATGWNAIDWSAEGLVFTEDYFVTYHPVLNSGSNPGSGPTNDHITVFVSNTDGLASPHLSTAITEWQGNWLNSTQAWGVDLDYIIDVDECCEEIPFTDCAFRNEVFDPFSSDYNAIFSLPHTGNCRQGLSMRFETKGVDTLVTARCGFTDLGLGFEPGAEMLIEILGDDGAGAPDPTDVIFSTTLGGLGNENDLIPFGQGFFESVDIPLGNIVLPALTSYHLAVRWNGPIPPNTGGVLGVDFDKMFLGGNASSGESDRGGIFYAGTYGTFDPACPGPTDPGTGLPLDGWFNYVATFGVPFEFWLDVETCADEFNDCELVTNYNSFAFVTCWAEWEGLNGVAGIFPSGGEECRIQQARVWMRDYVGLLGVDIAIHDDNAGLPGNVIYTEFVDQATWPVPPNPLAVTCDGADLVGPTFALDIFPNGGVGVPVVGPYYIVVTFHYDYSLGGAGQAVQWLRHDDFRPPDAVCNTLNGFDTLMANTGDINLWDGCLFGLPLNSPMENFRCCVPFNERTCVPGDDWPTYQHDQARTGATNNSLGALNCSLTRVWSMDSDKGNQFSGSVIAGDIVYISDDGGFDARELATGALIWDQDTDPTVSGLFANATGVRTQLTVVDVREDISQGGAWPGGLMTFLGSGLNRDIVAVDALTGTYVWHNTTNAPFPGLHPNTTNLKCVVFDDGFGADIVIYAAQKNVYAVIAQTGAPCPFWPTPGSGNPFVMGADNVNSVSTNNLDPGDGTVYVPTFSGAITANIYALNRFAGTLEWDLQTVVGDPNLASSGLPGTINNEGFFSGASVDNDNGVIWANSFFDADFPEEGFLYRVDQNGASWSAATSVRSRRATPIIDQNQIYVPSFTKWVNPRYRGGVGIFSRSTGLNLDALDRDGTGDRQLNDNLLTCEPGIDDWLVSGTELGSLNFYTVGNASQFMFSRNSTFSGFAGGQWMGGSMNSTHLVWTNLRGTTVALAPGGADRPRLEILNPTINTPVIFGTPPATDVTFPEAFTNTGCADLCIDSIRVDDVASPPSAGAARIEFTSVSPSLLKKMDEVADHATNSARFMKVGMMYGEASTGVDAFNSFAVNESPSGMNFRAAAGFPDVVTPNAGPDGSGVLSPAPGDCFAPGDVVDLHISIEGPAVTRGPHIFYATLWTNDPDYFLDLPNGPGPDAAPEVELNAVGGCLEDSTRIHFGLAGANSTTVYNNANIGRFTGNSANDIDINGFTEAAGLCGVGLTELFGGLRGYSLTPRRIAMTGPSWDGDDYQTILGNENYCTNNCIPALQTDVLLGSISTDQGATYTPVFGDLAAASYIDSAQDYSDGAGGWATDDFPDVFSPDSTIGLIANETHYGAKDVAELADFRLIRIDVTNRSATDSIIDLVHWAHHDDDIGANASNTVQGIPGSAGYAYAAQPGLGIAHGYVKVPSGCGIGNDVMRAAALDQPASWWAFEGGAWYDSLYRLAHLPGNDSIHFQAGMNTFEGEFGSAQDASSDYYFGGIDLGPGETKSFGIAQFVKVDCDNLDPGDDAQFIGLADLVNKWAGFHRGDVNNDLAMDLADIIYIANRVAGSANGAYPFEHLSDVNNDGATDMADVSYMVDFYFGCGPCPVSDWTLALCTP